MSETRDTTLDALLAEIDFGDWSDVEEILADDLAPAYADGMWRALAEIMRAQGLLVPPTVEARLGVSLDQVNQRALDWAKVHAADMVTRVSDATRTLIRNSVAQAIEDGVGAVELGKRLEESPGFNERRSGLIARSEITDASNAGNYKAYQDNSDVVLGKEWSTSGNATVCPICIENENAGPIALDDVFPSGDERPNAHPDAVFEGTSFVSYGSLSHALRARYDGPAIVLDLVLGAEALERSPREAGAPPDFVDGQMLREERARQGDLLQRWRLTQRPGERPPVVRLTIGPNHPMLTRRGLVRAGDLEDGDQLLYDRRIEGVLPGFCDPDFDEVPFFENAFEAMRCSGSHTLVSGAGAYFHGDEIALYGEVEAVRPAWDLLSVFEPGGIEQLGKCELVGAYADAAHVAGCRLCQERLARVFLTTSGLMSGGDSGGTLRGSAAVEPISAPWLEVWTATACHRARFRGWAFDATTATGFYNAGGFLVKNCDCVLLPVLEPFE